MRKNKGVDKKRLATKLVRAGTNRSNFGETSEAIFLNSGFCYDDAQTAESRFNGEEPGFVYSRYSNPTLKTLESRLIALEEGAEQCCVLSSGMAAVFSSLMSNLKTGDHIIANKVLFGSCFYIITEVLPKFGVDYTLVDEHDREAWEKAFQKNTTTVFIETPANPTLGITDIKFVAKLCKANNTFLIVDNIFATPIAQKPLLLGADAVVYSTTKHMDGQGRTLGGAILGSEEYITERLLPFHRHTGAAMSPFNAWVILKSLETLELRTKQHFSNAQKIASFLEASPSINKVYYPNLKSHPQYDIAQKQMSYGGGLIAFELKGDKNKTFQFLNNLQIIDISNNLGDSKSLITHPATTTHSNMEKEAQVAIGITEGLVRLSVGLEDVQDLIEDIQQALT